MKNVAKLMAIRFGVYGVMVLYLACDLFVFKGPIHRSLNEPRGDREADVAEAKASGVVARVYYRPIYRAQIEEKLKEYLWRRGKTIEDTTAGERRLLRRIVVHRLIDDELVKLQIKVSTSEEVMVPEEQIKTAFDEEMQRYPNREVFEELAERARWAGEKEKRMRLAARIQREEHLARMLNVSVSEDEAREWFEEHQESFPGKFEEHHEAIADALLIQKRDLRWKEFRVTQLRRYAEGKIELFEDVLLEEEGE